MMIKRTIFKLTALFLTGLLLSSCQAVQFTASSNTPAESNLEELLSYAPANWPEFHPVDYFGHAIIYTNYMQIRADESIPQSLSGENSREDKLEFITKVSLERLPPDIDLCAGSTYEKWGWDIADVHESLWLMGLGVIVMGNFERPEVIEKLETNGYENISVHEDFTIYTNQETGSVFAVRSDMLLISDSLPEEALSSIEFMIDEHKLQNGSVTHPSVTALMPYTEGARKIILATSPDLQTLSREIDLTALPLPDKLSKHVNDWLGQGEFDAAEWDIMAVIQTTRDEETILTFVYHYPSEAIARKNIDLVKETLADAPSLTGTTSLQTWSDYVSIEDIRAKNEFVIAKTTTTTTGNFIVSSIVNLNAWGLVPIEHR